MADLTPDQLDALAKGIAASGVAQETTLKALVKALGGTTGMASVAQATGKTAKEMKTVGSDLEDLSEDLEETSTGLNKYAKLQNTMAVGVTLATGKLNSLGSTVKYATAQMGTLGQSIGYAASTLLDALADNVDFYRQLSTVGATAGQSISDLRRVSGLTGLTMGQLTQAVAAAQGNLALLGGTAGQGFQRFSQALIELSQGETFEKLTGLGFTMDRIAEGAGEYLEIQTQLGRTQTMTSRELASGADEYLTNLDLLTRLTGKNRDMLAQEMKQNAADSRLKLQMAGMDQKQQAVIQRALSLTDKGSQELGQSLRNLIATGGIPTNAREAGILQLQGFSEALDRVSRGEQGSVEQLIGVFQSAALETGNLSAEERQRFAQLKQFGVDFFDVRFETIAFKNALGDLEKVTEEQRNAQEAAGVAALQFDRATQRLKTAFAAVLAPATTALAGLFNLISVPLEKFGNMDIKAEKDALDHGSVWVEYQNGDGHPGWLYGEAKFIVFDLYSKFIFVDREFLLQRANNLTKGSVYIGNQEPLNKYVYKSQALYKPYRRDGRFDILTKIKTEDIIDLYSHELPIPEQFHSDQYRTNK